MNHPWPWLLALLLVTPACRTKLRCYEHDQCDLGQRCNFETEQCVDDPCYGLAPGHFLRCEAGAALRCDASGLVETEACGALGCNEAEQRCNACVPSTSTCLGETWILCDAAGQVEAEERCLAGCDPTGCVPTCGDGRVDPGERCDDGNTDAGDGCSADCRSDETCGNGIVDTTTGEECDDGNATDWDGCTACAITELQVNAYEYGTQSEPSIAMAADGTATVVWTSASEDGPGRGSGVWGRQLDPHGRLLGADLQLSDNLNGDQRGPQVSAAPDGRFVAVWNHMPSTPATELRARRFSSDGAPDGASFSVSELGCSLYMKHSAATTASGRIAVAWATSCAPLSVDETEIAYRLFDAHGLPLAAPAMLNSTTADVQGSPSIAVVGNDRYLVAWHGEDPDLGGVFVREIGTQGELPGGELLVDGDIADGPSFPSLAGTTAGNAVAVWRRRHPTEVELGVFGQRLTQTGAKVGLMFQVNTFAPGVQAYPQVAMWEDGRFVVVWTSQDQDGDAGGIFAQVFDASANRVGGELPVNRLTAGNQNGADVAVDPTGGFTVVWSGPNAAGDARHVYAQRFDALGVRVGGGS